MDAASITKVLLILPWRRADVDGKGRKAAAMAVDFICFGIYHLERPQDIPPDIVKALLTRWINKTIGHLNYAKVGLLSLDDKTTSINKVVRSGRSDPN